jgi:hypothetical protein
MGVATPIPHLRVDPAARIGVPARWMREIMVFVHATACRPDARRCGRPLHAFDRASAAERGHRKPWPIIDRGRAFERRRWRGQILQTSK